MFRIVAVCAGLVLSVAVLAPLRAEPAAKQLFGAKTRAANLASGSYGSYTRGCLAGGKMLPVSGPAWQAMRLSRNRNWGHPDLVAYVERLALDAHARDGWPGLMVGDLAQPRGGPMITGHRSHQIGLDADIWMNPMPARTLSRQEREDISAVSMLATDKLSVDPKVWTDGHVRLLARAASYPQVARIFVHPAIKKKLCQAAGRERAWLRKIRPWWGHHYHFHVRLACPRGGTGCVDQNPPPAGDGCGKQLDDWFAMLRNAMKKPAKPAKPRRPITMAQLPATCRAVLNAKDEPQQIAAVSAGSADPNLPWLRGVAPGDAGRAQTVQPGGIAAQPAGAVARAQGLFVRPAGASTPAEGVPLPERRPAAR